MIPVLPDVGRGRHGFHVNPLAFWMTSELVQRFQLSEGGIELVEKLGALFLEEPCRVLPESSRGHGSTS